jgi:hypothetical protein
MRVIEILIFFAVAVLAIIVILEAIPSPAEILPTSAEIAERCQQPEQSQHIEALCFDFQRVQQ